MNSFYYELTAEIDKATAIDLEKSLKALHEARMSGCPYCGNNQVVLNKWFYPNRNTYACGFSRGQYETTPCEETYLVVSKKINLHDIRSLGFLTERSISILSSHGIETVQELISYSAYELLGLGAFGISTLNYIRNKLSQYDLKLSGD
jgi:Bacterial RNA polymerase, alpha chain C terminal domain